MLCTKTSQIIWSTNNDTGTEQWLECFFSFHFNQWLHFKRHGTRCPYQTIITHLFIYFLRLMAMLQIMRIILRKMNGVKLLRNCAFYMTLNNTLIKRIRSEAYAFSFNTFDAINKWASLHCVHTNFNCFLIKCNPIPGTMGKNLSFALKYVRSNEFRWLLKWYKLNPQHILRHAFNWFNKNGLQPNKNYICMHTGEVVFKSISELRIQISQSPAEKKKTTVWFNLKMFFLCQLDFGCQLCAGSTKPMVDPNIL